MLAPAAANSGLTVHPSDCLIVIPAFNEAATVAKVVAGAREATGSPVLVVSDASEDDTVAQAEAAGARVLALPIRLGAWCAIQAGLRYARRHGYRQVVTIDADGQHPVSALVDLCAALADSDVVIGTCPQRLSVAKRIAWAYFRLLTGLRVVDVTSGLRAYGEPALELLVQREASLLDYQDIGVLLLLAAQDMRIDELPVAMSEREVGKSRVFSSWLSVTRYMIHTTVLCLAQVGRSAPPAETEMTST